MYIAATVVNLLIKMRLFVLIVARNKMAIQNQVQHGIRCFVFFKTSIQKIQQ